VESLAKTNKDYAQIVSRFKVAFKKHPFLISWIKEDSDKAFGENSAVFSMMENKVEKMDHLIQGY
jgi:hypothetical protein